MSVLFSILCHLSGGITRVISVRLSRKFIMSCYSNKDLGNHAYSYNGLRMEEKFKMKNNSYTEISGLDSISTERFWLHSKSLKKHNNYYL